MELMPQARRTGQRHRPGWGQKRGLALRSAVLVLWDSESLCFPYILVSVSVKWREGGH